MSLIKQTFVFCGCNRFDFQTDNGQIKMTKVDLVSLDNKEGENSHGFDVITLNAPYDLFHSLAELTPMQKVIFEIELTFGKKSTKREIVGISK